MGNRAGVIIGAVLGLILIGAIAGTPFYLRQLQTDDRAVAGRITKDVETIRRAVFNLDPHTALTADIYKSDVPRAAISDEELAELDGVEPTDIFTRDVMQELNRTVQLLQDVESHDSQRGIRIIGKGVVERARLKVKNVTRKMRSEYLKEHDVLLRKADAALTSIRSVTQGSASGTSHLWAARLRAILQLAKGRLYLNNAEFEYDQAALAEQSAQENVTALAALRAQLQRLETRSPQTLAADVEARIKQIQAGITAVEQGIATIKRVISAQEAQAAELKKQIADANEALAAIAPNDTVRFGEISARRRQAESALAAIEQGTLRDATPVPEDSAELKPPTYEGGTPQSGLDAFRFRLEHAQAQLKSLNAMLDRHNKELAELGKTGEQLAAEKAATEEQIEAQNKAMSDLLAEADARRADAAKAHEQALKNLKDAARSAKEAVAAAKKVNSDARQGATNDERLTRVSQETDTEASMQCLVGEIAYTTAVAQYEFIQSAQRAAAAREGDASGEDTGAARTEAINQLAEAAKAYEQASNLLGRSTARFGTNSISGKNYVWQTQVALAAVHLLHSVLLADDEEASFAEKTAAYDALKAATEKREQSPLLSPAFDTLIYLQQSVR